MAMRFTLRFFVKLAFGLFALLIMSVGSALLVVAWAGYQAPKPPDTILYDKAIPYAKVGDKTLLLDLARPKQGKGPFPVVICIHGGGWRAGDRSEYLDAVFNLAQKGYVAATVQYRLAPDARLPSQIQDVKAAIRFLKSHAEEWKIDVNRFGVLGGSAGGHLALLLATTDDDDFEIVGDHPEFSSRVQAVAAVAGPADLTQVFPEASEYMVVDLIGKPRLEAPEAYLKASPLHYVGPGDAPILLIHGDKDELVPYSQSVALTDAYGKAKLEAELFTIKDGTHGGGGKPDDWAKAIIKAVEFLDRHLKPGTMLEAK